MRNGSGRAALLAGSLGLITGCSFRASMPAGFAEADATAVWGDRGITGDVSLSFAGYTVDEARRQYTWNDGWFDADWLGPHAAAVARHHRSKVLKLRLTGGAEVWRGWCEILEGVERSDLLIDIRGAAKAVSCMFTTNGGAKFAELVVAAGGREYGAKAVAARHADGRLQVGTKQYGLDASWSAAGVPVVTDNVTSWSVIDEGKPLAGVDLFAPGRVWLLEDIPANQRDPFAAAVAALLLAFPPGDNMPEGFSELD